MRFIRLNHINKILRDNLKYLVIMLIGIAILVRVIVALILGDQVNELPGTFDQISYNSLALRVLGGHGFTFNQPWWPITAAGEPTAHWSYLYTIYLTLVYAIFGPHPLAARLIQAIIVGILHPYLVYLIANRIFNQIVGLTAAGLTALYTYFVYYSGTLMTEPFYLTALMAGLFITIELIKRNSTDQMRKEYRSRYLLIIAFGLSFGTAILLRQLAIMILPFVYLWIVIANRTHALKYSFKIILISIAVIFVMILPFTVLNYQRFGEFVLLNTNAGYALFWANHPIHGTQFIPILPSTTYQELIPSDLTHLNEAALDKALLSQGMKFIFEDPVRYFLLSISRIPAYFIFWPSTDSSLISNVSRVSSFGILLPFMIYGLIYSFISYRKKGFCKFIGSPLFLLYSFIFIYTAIHILSWTLVRYRLPVDSVLLVFASLAVVDIFNRCKAYLPAFNSMGEKVKQDV